MPTRTHTSTVVFRHPFSIKSAEGLLSAGTYAVEAEEELVKSLSFPAYRRRSTTIKRQANDAGALVKVLTVDPHELDAAQTADCLWGTAASAALGWSRTTAQMVRRRR